MELKARIKTVRHDWKYEPWKVENNILIILSIIQKLAIEFSLENINSIRLKMKLILMLWKMGRYYFFRIDPMKIN